MDKKVKTIEQLRTLQELFPLHIISAMPIEKYNGTGWVANTTNIEFQFEQESFDDSAGDSTSYDHIALYLEAEDLVLDLLDNIELIDIDKSMDVSSNNFDIQGDILDGCFQSIRLLNEYSKQLRLDETDDARLEFAKDQIIALLRKGSDKDKEDDFLFNTLLREISNAEWRTNVYFDKL